MNSIPLPTPKLANKDDDDDEKKTSSMLIKCTFMENYVTSFLDNARQWQISRCILLKNLQSFLVSYPFSRIFSYTNVNGTVSHLFRKNCIKKGTKKSNEKNTILHSICHQRMVKFTQINQLGLITTRSIAIKNPEKNLYRPTKTTHIHTNRNVNGGFKPKIGKKKPEYKQFFFQPVRSG